MDVFFFKIALAAYTASTLAYLASLVVRRVWIAKGAGWIFFSAFLLHTVYFIFRFPDRGIIPAQNIFEALSFFAWAVAGIFLAFQLRTKTRVLGALVSPVALVLMLLASVKLGSEALVPVALQGRLVSVHILLSVTGEALFAVACLAGVMYLAQDNLIKNRRITTLSRYLPSLRDLDNINHICLLWGFPLLTLGVIAGSLWARSVWTGSEWPWDPKMIWTLSAWVFYGILLHQRLAIGWKGRKIAFFSILAFAILLFAFVGVNMFYTSVHRFV
jgi:cytochrome c-type biogenesis protein CcsB